MSGIAQIPEGYEGEKRWGFAAGIRVGRGKVPAPNMADRSEDFATGYNEGLAAQQAIMGL